MKKIILYLTIYLFYALPTMHSQSLDCDNKVASIVADIRAGSNSSSPNEFISYGNNLYFSASDGINGTELWKYDVQLDTAYMVQDIRPGSNSSSPGYIMSHANNLYFKANDGTNGTELWKYDVQLDTAYMFQDIRPGSNSGSPAYIISHANNLYFRATDGMNGTELWKYDTQTGLVSLEYEFRAGYYGSNIQSIYPVGSKLFITADNGLSGGELWIYENDSAILYDLYPGLEFDMMGMGSYPNSSYPSNFIAHGNDVYFQANDGIHGYEFWKYDSTTGSCTMIDDLRFGSAGSNPSYMTSLGSKIYFGAYLNNAGCMVEYDTQTEEFFTINLSNGAANWSTPYYVALSGNEIFFSYNDGNIGAELWKLSENIGIGGCTDILALNFDSAATCDDGSCQVLGCTDPSSVNYNVNATIDDNSCVSCIFGCMESTNCNYNPLATCDDGSCKSEIDTDYYDALLGNPDSYPEGKVELGGKIYYSAFSQNSSFMMMSNELYVFDIQSQTATQLTFDQSDYGGSEVYDIVSLNNKIYYRTHVYNQQKIYVYDPNTGSNGLALSLPYNSSPTSLNVFGSNLLFRMDNQDGTGHEPWKWDSQTNQLSILADINPGSSSSYPSLSNGIENGNNFYFYASDGTNGSELWTYDSQLDTVYMVQDISPGNSSSYPSNFASNGTDIFFQANDGTHGTELWKYDLQLDLAYMVQDIRSGSNGSSPQELFSDSNGIYFQANDGTNGTELWKYDLQLDTAYMVQDIRPGSNSAYARDFVSNGIDVYFRADDGTNGSELWKLDTQTDSAYLFLDLNLNSGSNPNDIISYGDYLFMTAIGNFGGYELHWLEFIDDIYGCLDPISSNYDSNVTCDDGSCLYEGCTDTLAINYDPVANTDDGSCISAVYGCTDPQAFNFNAAANVDDGSCISVVLGCTDPIASNYDPTANTDDGSCIQPISGCTDPTACNFDPNAIVDDGFCLTDYGCIDPTAFNYDSTATCDDGSCIAVVYGCTYPSASNYDPNANTDDGSCSYINFCLSPIPTNTSVIDIIDTRVRITWDNMTSISCVPEQYRVQYRVLGSTSWNQKNIVSDGTCTSFGQTSKLLTNLTPTTTYEYRVKAWYCYSTGSSSWSSIKTFTTLDNCPNVGNFTVSTPFNTRATFSWDDSNGPYSFLRIKLRVDSISNPSAADWQNAGGFGVNYGTHTRNKNGLVAGETYRGQSRTWCDPQGGPYKSSTWTPLIFWTQPSSVRMEGNLGISELEVYPNPSRDIFNISLTSEQEQNFTLRVLNLLGEELIKEDVQKFVGEYVKSINLNQYEKAIYLLEIITDKGTINKKLILQ